MRRIVYLSGLHPENADLSPHLASRKAVGEALIDSGVETVVLQAGVVIGSGSASFEMIRHLIDRLPVMTTPKWVHNRIQPIAVRDVLHYLAAAATTPVPKSRTWDIGGPDVLEYGDMMRVYAEVAGLGNRYLFVLPFLTPAIASLWVGLVTPIPSGLARPLVESLECDAVTRDSDIDDIIAPQRTGSPDTAARSSWRCDGPPAASPTPAGPRCGPSRPSRCPATPTGPARSSTPTCGPRPPTPRPVTCGRRPAPRQPPPVAATPTA